MEIITSYIENLFLQVPNNLETQKVKQELLATMEDHFQELLLEGKSEAEAVGLVLNEFGSLDELLDELQIKPKAAENEIQLVEALAYLAHVRKFSLAISTGILLCCVALGGLIASINARWIGFSVIGFFFFVAIAVALFITSGLTHTQVKQTLDDRPFTSEVKQHFQGIAQDYQPSFTVSLVTGIMMCICSLIPLIAGTALGLFGNEQIGVGLFLVFAGLGTFLIVYGSIIFTEIKKIERSEFFISSSDAPGPRASEELYGENYQTAQFVKSIYWPIIIVIYFVWSFLWGAWGISWLIFIVGGILEEVIFNFLKKGK
ncbi:MAG: permease prefix domain 1-containing protein [Enterococcus sp.]